MIINGDKIIVGGTQSPANEFLICGTLTAATTTAVGGMLRLQNTYDVDIIVTDVIIDTTTGSTGVAAMNMGAHATGWTSMDTLLSALNMQTVGILDNRIDHGANGGMVIWRRNEFIVATATATTAGLVSRYKIKGLAR